MRLPSFNCSCPTSTTDTSAANNFSLLPILLLLLFFSLTFTECRADKVDECCRAHNIPDVCVQTLCYPLRPPGDFDVYDIFQKKNNCSKHLPEIAQCLADGRNHMHCCKSEAKDSEENACFGLCEGIGKTKKSWAHYQSCLAINLPSMFLCLQKGYTKTPSPPQHLRLEQIETNSVLIKWEEPEVNAGQVKHYRVIISEQVESTTTNTESHKQKEEYDENNEEEEESDDEEESKPNTPAFLNGHAPKRIEIEIGRETSIKVENLQPGTLYNAFVLAVGSEPKQRSLSSDMLDFQTIGIAPQVFPYKKQVNAPNGAKSTVIACRFHMSSISYKTAKIQWQHKATDSGNFKTLTDSDHYNSSHYIWSFDRPREYIMMLQINRVISSDFGLYRCSVSDSYGNGNADVQFSIATLEIASSTPPESPLDCCESRGVEKRCMSMCGATEGSDLKRYIPRPFMPSNCSVQISRVLSCAMPGIDDSECCLLKNVPRACIYLCDSSVAPENHMNPLCLQYILSVESCRVDGVEQRPSSVLGLKAQTNLGTSTVAVQWEPSVNAEIYHVYWRRQQDSEWQQKSALGTNKKIQTGADEIVLVAANVYGISQAARLTLNNSKWIQP